MNKINELKRNLCDSAVIEDVVHQYENTKGIDIHLGVNNNETFAKEAHKIINEAVFDYMKDDLNNDFSKVKDLTKSELQEHYAKKLEGELNSFVYKSLDKANYTATLEVHDNDGLKNGISISETRNSKAVDIAIDEARNKWKSQAKDLSELLVDKIYNKDIELHHATKTPELQGGDLLSLNNLGNGKEVQR